MFKCDLCHKEKPDQEEGKISLLAKICWFLVFLIPGIPGVPPTTACKKCESKGNASIGYVAIVLGFVVLVLIMIPIANRAYPR